MNTFKVLCVYDMTLVLLEWNGKMFVKWLSEQFWSYCSYMYVLIETADERHTSAVYLTLVNKTVLLLHSYRDDQNMQDSCLIQLLRHTICKY